MQILSTLNAPTALGPYSQAVFVNDTMYLAGQIAINPITGNIQEGDIKAQTRQVMDNIKAVLSTKNMTLDNVVRCEVYLLDMDDFGEMNEVYAEYFGEHKPARATVQVSGIAKNSKVEITATAVVITKPNH
jgi:2-iminobutanoate/2-iminopropanoate deaminase